MEPCSFFYDHNQKLPYSSQTPFPPHKLIDKNLTPCYTNNINIHLYGVTPMAYTITDACISCGACESECPVSCISEGADKYEINAAECIDCGACAGSCPVEAIKA